MPRHAFGGGIDVYDVEAITLTNNVIAYNTAIMSGVQGAGGGGIDIGLPSGDGQRIVLRGNKIMENTAAYTMTGREFGVMGGGLHVGVGGEDTDVDGNMLTMENNQIIGNVGVWALDAFGNNVQAGARGGGVHVEGVETVVASGNEVRGNVLAESFSMTGDDSGNQGGNADGGGMQVERSMSVTIHNNVFADNIVVRDQNIVGVSSGGSGGGLTLQEVEEAVLTDNRIVHNTAVLRGSFQSDTGEGCNISGGGLGIHGGQDMMGHFTVKNNRIASNTALGRATVQGDFAPCHSEGGGMMMRGISVTVMTGNQFEGNLAARNLTMDGDGSYKWGGRAAGGGLFAGDSYSVTLLNNQFVDNVTMERLTVRDVASGSEAGGFALINVDNGVAKGNTVLRNTALISGSITSDAGEHVGAQGGGVLIGCWDKPDCLIVFEENDILNNISAGEILRQGSNVDTNAGGGGISVQQSKMIVSGNTISGNVGIAIGPDGGAGAIDIGESDVIMEGNRILGNRSRAQFGGGSAVGAYRSVVLSTNDIFARNTGGFGGGGDGGAPTTATLINDTFYDNQDVGIHAWEQAVVTVTNTIVYSHNSGLRVDQVQATIKGDYNLLDNGINYDNGVTPGSHDITGKVVKFVDAANDDFHLEKDSPAIDAGDNGAAPSDDFDSKMRPLDGNGDGQAVADIGAYEYGVMPVYLPSIFK